MPSCKTMLATTTSKLVKATIPILNLIGKKTNLNPCKSYAHAYLKSLGDKAYFALDTWHLAPVQTFET